MEDHPFPIQFHYQDIRYDAVVVPCLEKDVLKYRIRFPAVKHIPAIEIEVCPDEDPVGPDDMFWTQREEKDRNLMKDKDFVQAIGRAIELHDR